MDIKFTKRSKQIFLLVIALALVGGLVLGYLLINRSTEANVNSYSECVTAGYDVNTDLTVGPPSCKTPEGKYFYPPNVIVD